MLFLQSWLIAFRPKTLPAAMAPVIAATGLARMIGQKINLENVLWLLLATLSIQIATNLFNDAVDFKKGADRHRIGPQRVTQSGLFSPQAVLLMGIFFCCLTIVFSVPLVQAGGIPILILGLISLLLTYGYTGGPYPLAYHGLGDLFVFLFFGLIAVCGTYFILCGWWGFEPFILGLQIGCFSTVLIAINNLRDSDTDRQVSKQTLAVRFGDTFVKREIACLNLIPFLLLIYWYFTTERMVFLLPLVLLPLSFSIVKKVFSFKDKRELNGLLAKAGLQLILFSCLFSFSCFFTCLWV